MQFSLDTLRDVAHLLRDTGLYEISVENTDEASGEPFRVTMRRNATPQRRRPPATATGSTAPSGPPAAVREEAATENGASSPFEMAQTARVTVTSTAVGLFRAPKPLLRGGDSVVVGQVVGIVESMKIPNEILAPVSGRIVELQIEDGHGVEYGQPLLIIEPGTV
jgi:acetyl-CoA carboxylase biotin carboxyl carrier protein